MIYLYVALIILLHLIPLGNIHNTLEFGPLRADYLFHILLFLPWMMLLTFYHKPCPWGRWLVLGLLLAFVVEGVQYWLPYRAFNPWDLVFNALGVLLGGLGFWLWGFFPWPGGRRHG